MIQNGTGARSFRHPQSIRLSSPHRISTGILARRVEADRRVRNIARMQAAPRTHMNTGNHFLY